MKKQMIFSFFVSLLMLVALPAAHAQLHAVFSLPEMVQHSDAICIGTVDPAPANTSDANGDTIVTVRQVLKGTISSAKIKIDHDHGNNELQWVRPNHNGIFFLGQSSPSGVWQYVDYPSFLGTVINLGDTPPPALPEGLTPLRAVLLAMAQALPNIADENYRINLLDTIQDGLRVNIPGNPRNEELARSLGETAGFGEFCTKQVLPLIMKYSHDSDPHVRAYALWIAALLQDETVMPQLRTLAEKGDPHNTMSGYPNIAEYGLAAFRTPHSVPFMLSALHSHSQEVQQGALSSLVGTLHRDALPVLLDRIVNPHDKFHISVIYWLWQVTGEMKIQGDDLALGRQEKYVQFWKTWKQAHQEEVQALRKKLDAQSKRTD